MPLGSPEPIDLANARVITLIGSHLGENMHNTQVQELAEALGRGAQLVVVDPRFSVAAGKARYWLPIKPGTDIALLLAWINVLLEEKLYDAEYLAAHAVGLEELKAHVADKTPEWAWPHHRDPPGAHPRARRASSPRRAPPRSSTPAATPSGTATTPSASARWRSCGAARQLGPARRVPLAREVASPATRWPRRSRTAPSGPECGHARRRAGTRSRAR